MASLSSLTRSAFSLRTVIVLLSATALFSMTALELGAPATTVNPLVLLTLLVLCAGAAAVTLSRRPIQLWYPLPWFLMTSAAYYGFGPLLYYFGNPETISFADRYFAIRDKDIASVNLLTVMGVAAVLASYLIAKSTLFKKTPVLHSINGSAIPTAELKLLALAFMAIGIPINVLFVLPRALGLWEVTLPGSFETLSSLSLLAIVLLIELRRRPGQKFIAGVLLLLLFSLELATAFLTLSKFAILKVIIACGLAWVLRAASFRTMLLTGIAVFFLYAYVLSPLISYGRDNFNVTGLTSSSDANLLVRDLTTGKVHQDASSGNAGAQTWWSRLNYANAQAFAIQAYEDGSSGDTLALAIWAFIPRAIYPDKPIMNSGTDFNVLVTGNPYSKSAPGMLAEGYWNLGIAGLLLVSGVLGLIMAAWESYTARHLVSGHFQYLPVMWMGLFSVVQQDSWFVPGTFGMATIAIAFHWMTRFFYKPKIVIR